MHVTSIRYRSISQETWNFLRFPVGSGDLKNLQIIEADSITLPPILAAFRFALTGHSTGQPSEVVLQLHDDDGTSWSIMRKSSSLRITKDGEVVDSQYAFQQILQNANLNASDPFDFEREKSKFFRPMQLAIESNKVELWALGTNEPPHLSLARHLKKQIEINMCQIVETLGLKTPLTQLQTIKLGEKLEPIYIKYLELEQWSKQWVAEKDQSISALTPHSMHDNQQKTHKFAKELTIMSDIQTILTPLIGPQALSLNSLEKQHAAFDKQIESMEKVTGPIQETLGQLPDFNQAIDILCRLQAYGKLVRTTQNLRDHCETNLEPHLKSYLNQTESMGSTLRDLLEELQADQIKLQHQREILVPKDLPNESPHHSSSLGKNWFDLFKKPTKISPQEKQAAPKQEDFISESVQRLAGTVDRILLKGSSILAALPSQEVQHETLKQAFDEAIDQLVQKYSQLRQEWVALAKNLHLPESLDIVSLIKYVIIFARSVVLKERRDWVRTQIVDYQDRINRLEKLIIQWRKVTESQKQNPIDEPQLIIEEAVAITRYLESKIKRFDQVIDQYADHNVKGKVLEIILGQFAAEKRNLLQAWSDETHRLNLPTFPIHGDSTHSILHSARKVKTYSEIIQTADPNMSSKNQQSAMIEMWVINQESLDAKVLADYFQCSVFGSSILLVCPYPSITQNLAHLGASIGILTARQVSPQSPPAPGLVQPTPTHAKPSPTLKKPSIGPPSSVLSTKATPTGQVSSETLQARAERVLAMLGPRDQYPKRP